MASGRLSSTTVAPSQGFKVYTNTSGNAEYVSIFASSQTAGQTPAIGVKISTENITESIVVQSVQSSGLTSFNVTLAESELPQSTSTWEGPFEATEHRDGSAEIVSISRTQTGTRDSRYARNVNIKLPRVHGNNNTYMGGFVSPIAFGSGSSMAATGTSTYNNATWLSQVNMPFPDPYYLGHPEEYHSGLDSARWAYCAGHSVLYFFSDFNAFSMEQQETLYTDVSINTSSTIGTNYSSNGESISYHTGWRCYDPYTLTWISFQNSSSSYWSTVGFLPDGEPLITTNSNDMSNSTNYMPHGSGTAWGGTPSNYWPVGNTFGTYMELQGGILVNCFGSYNQNLTICNLRDSWYSDWQTRNTVSYPSDSARISEPFASSAYTRIQLDTTRPGFAGIQWFLYNPNTDKYYMCIGPRIDSHNSSDVSSFSVISTSASYGIFEIHRDKLPYYNRSQGVTVDTYGVSRSTNNWAWTSTQKDAVMTQVATPFVDPMQSAAGVNTPLGLMMKPIRIGQSLWVSYTALMTKIYSQNLYEWYTKENATFIPSDVKQYDIIEKEADYWYVANFGEKEIKKYGDFSNSPYSQVNAKDIIANGAVLPYEQRNLIINNGDNVYIENQDTTYNVSATIMGVPL